MRIQLKRGTTAQADEYVGRVGELTADIERKELRLHNGVTPGGVVVASVIQAPQGALYADVGSPELVPLCLPRLG